MKQKIALGLGALATTLAVLPLFAAFEAHVINVTARIENALAVPLSHIDFGTVFPQEWLGKPLRVTLSDSFLDEDRVDDVDYFIRQKPKCGVTTLDGQTLVEGSTQTGHVVVGNNPATPDVEEWWVDCGEAPMPFDSTTHVYGQLPMLCPYISKHPDNRPENDGSLDSFHHPFAISQENDIVWLDTKGHLAKSQNDTEDTWTVDLAVPCFGGYCAQDWAEFVKKINPLADASEWTQPIENEHKVFGCDLWVEVYGISLPGFGCKGKVDVMLVLDRSGSISLAELADLKTAAKAFVDALALAANGAHAGEVSFGLATATLDQGLTDNATAVKTAIDGLVASGLTNYQAALDAAAAELAGPNDRNDAEAPDVIVMITDGEPTAGTPDPATGGTNSANAAKAAGIEIFAVGVGVNASGAAYLKTNIVSSPDTTHYFDAANYASLSTVLSGLTQCTPTP